MDIVFSKGDWGVLLIQKRIRVSPLFYETKVDLSQIFCAIGSMMGHEIFHAFDNVGSLYDKNGYMEHGNDLTKRYHECRDHANCIKDQYPSIVMIILFHT